MPAAWPSRHSHCMAQRGFCGRPTQDNTPCRNPPGCSINHGAHRSGVGAANDQAARDASRQEFAAATSRDATSPPADLIETTRSVARSQFESMCSETINLDGLLYGVRGQSSVDFEQLRNTYALAERCADGDLDRYSGYGIDALSTLGHYAQIEADAKAVLESRPMPVYGDQRDSALRLAEYALSELSESGSPLDEAVGEAQRRMLEVKGYVADCMVSELGDSGITQIADSDDPEAAIAAVFEETLREARAAFDETYGSGEQFAWAVPDDDTIAPTATERARLVTDVVADIPRGWATIDEVVVRARKVQGLRSRSVGSLHEALNEAVEAGNLSVISNDMHTIWRPANAGGDPCDCGGEFMPGDDGPDWVCNRCGKKDFEQYPERT